MTRHQSLTTGRVTTNNEAIQLYLGVRFSRAPRNPLRGATEYGALCDSDVVVVFPADQPPTFPFEVTLPDPIDEHDLQHALTNP
ncbi:hypothetical protein A6E15_19090 [Natrinema saccharevitans]|uniref:Uncharacterized protein n=1 Tax=Natrinema saccharevitans TaxID=301967 RepID=A0A1S8ARC2_9EURY|nr:hypothetical protein [Natrinema saccharevitans]OLZ39071.1 hypothetical protein A6E15_19090 [Natrinema saccharevitans]